MSRCKVLWSTAASCFQGPLPRLWPASPAVMYTLRLPRHPPGAFEGQLTVHYGHVVLVLVLASVCGCCPCWWSNRGRAAAGPPRPPPPPDLAAHHALTHTGPAQHTHIETQVSHHCRTRTRRRLNQGPGMCVCLLTSCWQAMHAASA